MKSWILIFSLLLSANLFAGPVVKIEFDVIKNAKGSDVLLVIDNSYSMQEHHDKLIKVTDIFIEEFKNVDYQLTAIDTDVQSRQLYNRLPDAQYECNKYVTTMT